MKGAKVKKNLRTRTLQFTICNLQLQAQNIGINATGAAPNVSAALDVDMTNKGLLIPRVALTSTTDVSTITTPATSLLVYNNNAAMTGGGLGFYYWNGTNWVSLTPAPTATDWTLLGNAGTVDGTNFIGTTDNVPFNIRVNNQKAGRIYGETTFYGYQSGNLNLGFQNTGFGYRALYKNTTGNRNVAIGNDAIASNTTGGGNIACGFEALLYNQSGSDNVACGIFALRSNVIGNFNTAIGGRSLWANNGGGNTAIGFDALFSNTTGGGNVACGFQALSANSTGGGNIAVGGNALLFNTIGDGNIAIGSNALRNNTTAGGNIAIGGNAMYYNLTGIKNVALGSWSGFGAPAIDFNQCTFLGSNSYPTVVRTNVTMLGYGIVNAQCTGDNQVLIGNTAITQIRSQITGLTAYSDARFKSDIKADVVGLDFILKLKPVTYNQNPIILHEIWETPDSLVRQINHAEIDTIRFTGFLAQEVEDAMKKTGYNFTGIEIPKNSNEVYSLRYIDFIMPLVKSIQEQQEMIVKLEEKIEVLSKLLNVFRTK